MSVQFGRWHFEGQPAAVDYLEKVRGVLAPYGPDGESSYAKAGVDILYFAFHTNKESRQETQPHDLRSGAVLTWDGRLDNRAELIGLLGAHLSPEASDLSVVAGAYERWGTDCFAKLIGDWALSIWNPHDRWLVLAKDPIGTRHLSYSAENGQITWCTVLDPLVLIASRTFAVEEEYIAGWLGQLPATHLTPYVGIHSVPPSCFVRLEQGNQTLRKYWDFDPDKRIHYQSDAQYEEHFRTVFRESICRRLRSDAPILAELSGGMDSSSIVCLADTIIASGVAATPRLDTLSYYNESEPNWNERPYFTLVEEKRGRTGVHIDVSSPESFHLGSANGSLALTPSGISGRPTEASRQFTACVASQGNRVVLSGIGGDEFTGGVPTPTPELENLLSRGQFSALAHQLKIWALVSRRPWIHLLLEVVRRFFPPQLVPVPKDSRPAPWLCPAFAKRHRASLSGYPPKIKLLGPLPSFQENLCTLDVLRRQLSACLTPSGPHYEKWYPYLDRDLLAFTFAIPREQLVQPGFRRSLTRRALASMVPSDILNRKRKAFVARSPIVAISTQWGRLFEFSQQMISASLGIVDAEALRGALQAARGGMQSPVVLLMRTLAVESWLRVLNGQQVLQIQNPASHPGRSRFDKPQTLVRPFREKELR